MSYCRWSSDDFQCDVYCYAHMDGTWTTHVAGSRYAGDIPRAPWELMKTDLDAWQKARAAQSAFLEEAALEPIDLPHAGETFKDESPAAMRERLLSLRALGYRVPDYALQALADEEAERTA